MWETVFFTILSDSGLEVFCMPVCVWIIIKQESAMVVLITCSLEIIHYANSCLHCNWGAVSVYLVTYRYVMIISSFYCHLFSLMIYGSFVISWFPYMHCISMCIGSFFDIILWCTDYYLYSWRFFGAAYFSTHQLVGAGVCVCVGMRVYVCVCVG